MLKKQILSLFTHSRVDRNAVVVRLGNKTISQVKSVKFLGIHTDDKLNYNDQTCVLSKNYLFFLILFSFNIWYNSVGWLWGIKY